jgi:hypothetical protein
MTIMNRIVARDLVIVLAMTLLREEAVATERIRMTGAVISSNTTHGREAGPLAVLLLLMVAHKELVLQERSMGIRHNTRMLQ